MGHKAFPCIEISGDHAKSHGTHQPIQPVGHSPRPKISRQLHRDTCQMSWGCRPYGTVALDPYLLIWRGQGQRDRQLLYVSSWITLITYTLRPFDKPFVFLLESHHQIVHPCLEKKKSIIEDYKMKSMKNMLMRMRAIEVVVRILRTSGQKLQVTNSLTLKVAQGVWMIISTQEYSIGDGGRHQFMFF